MDTITKLLCSQAKAGDAAAYSRLFHIHTERALFFIRARLGPRLRSTVESGDVLQDAYLAAHRAFDQFNYVDDNSFFRWLCRIIDNRIRDWNDYAQAEKRQAVPLPAPSATGPVTALDRKLVREQLLSALERLSDDHREVLLLRYFEGLSSDEAGQRLGRSAGAVRKLTARALSELGKSFTGRSTAVSPSNGKASYES